MIEPAQKLGQSAQELAFSRSVHALTRIWFSLIDKHLTAGKLTDNSQEEEPGAAEKVPLTLLSPVKTYSTFLENA